MRDTQEVLALRKSVRVAAAVGFLLALSVFAADFTVGCGQRYVYGIVSAKYPATGDNQSWTIQVVDEWYTVPENFYYETQVGDTVKFDGRDWTIVKSAGTTLPGKPGREPQQPPPNVPPSLANPPNQPTTH